jgi:hypothetical protein
LEIRQARTILKDKLRFKLITLQDALEDPVASRMKVADLLQALPYIGLRRAQQILEECGIPADNTVARCGPKQIAALIMRMQ